MIRKSIPSFVLALIAGIVTILVGIYTAWVSVVIAAFGGTQYLLFLALGWTCIIGGIVAIVGASFCFRRAKVGAIILTIVTATAGVALVWIFIKIMEASSSASTSAEELSSLSAGVFLGVFTLIPAIMYVIATIFAYLAKPINKQEPQQFAYQTVQNPEQTTEQVVQSVDNQTTNDIKKE